MEPTEEPTAERCDCPACRSGLRDELAARIREMRRAVAVLDSVELAPELDESTWRYAHALVIDAAERLSGTATLIRFAA
jgi:hypothetical protein